MTMKHAKKPVSFFDRVENQGRGFVFLLEMTLVFLGTILFGIVAMV